MALTVHTFHGAYTEAAKQANEALGRTAFPPSVPHCNEEGAVLAFCHAAGTTFYFSRVGIPMHILDYEDYREGLLEAVAEELLSAAESAEAA